LLGIKKYKSEAEVFLTFLYFIGLVYLTMVNLMALTCIADSSLNICVNKSNIRRGGSALALEQRGQKCVEHGEKIDLSTGGVKYRDRF
jgi:hypothetical protein